MDLTPNADAYVLPAPVAEIKRPLLSPLSMDSLSLVQNANCIELGLNSFLISFEFDNLISLKDSYSSSYLSIIVFMLNE